MTKLSNTPVIDGKVTVCETAEHFAAEREVIFKLIGSPNQVEAITASFENRVPAFRDVGQE